MIVVNAVDEVPWICNESGTERITKIPFLVICWQMLRIPKEDVKTEAMSQISGVNLSKEFLT